MQDRKKERKTERKQERKTERTLLAPICAHGMIFHAFLTPFGFVLEPSGITLRAFVHSLTAPRNLLAPTWDTRVIFHQFSTPFGAFLDPSGATVRVFFYKKGPLESSKDLYHFFMDFELHSERSNIEFSMVFTDPNACRPYYEKLNIFVQIYLTFGSQNDSPNHQGHKKTQ